MAVKKETSLQRFWKKIWKNPVTECWEWIADTSMGYGRFNYKGKRVPAHRFAYQQLKDELLEDYELHHICINRKCVNPLHLDQVTRKEHFRRHAQYKKDNFKEKQLFQHYEVLMKLPKDIKIWQ